MRRPIPLTGSSPDLTTDPVRDRFFASLRKQLLKVAQTHFDPQTRALFQAMADGKPVHKPRVERKPEPAPTPEPPSTPVVKASSPRRAPPPRPTFKRPSALEK